MAKKSAGLLMYRIRERLLEVFLVHPGGPFWVKKDLGSWSIPKGEYTAVEDSLDAARREFREETGFDADGEFISLKPVRQTGGKEITAWAFEGDLDPASVRSNTFSMEWPPKSGKRVEFPEIDRAAWFSLEIARAKILKAQIALLDELFTILNRKEPDAREDIEPPPHDNDG
jgi:predicted NUDIX family NTP pyrophosphohydrolase